MWPNQDETIELFDTVSVSAGVRGLQILISPKDYIRAVHAAIVPVAQPKRS